MPVAEPTRSAHRDTFTRDALPPREAWPELLLLDYPDQLNCAVELIDQVVARLGGDRPCLLDGTGAVWTYADLLRHSNQVAHVLAHELGVVPGERILLRGPNNPWLVACWLGVLKAGAVAVSSMPLLRSAELSVICDIAKVRLALVDSRFVEEVDKAAVPGLRVVEYGGAGDDDLVARAAAGPPDFDSVATAADDVCLLAFTSGTTGKPKATMHFHQDVLAIADTFSRHVVQPRSTDVFAGSPPLAFTFGLGGLVVFPLRAGAATLLLERATPDELFAAVGQHGVSVLFTAPTAYRAALRQIGDYDLRTLRRCVSAGEALPLATWQAFYDATGVRIIDGIGATELLHVFIASCDDEIRPGSTGKPVPGYIACILAEDGRPVPDGQPGLLAVKGPTGCRYLSDPRQSSYVRDGWNVTGDVFVRDADGYFWYQARADDMIVSSGYNIAGPEVEQALLGHPDVVEAGVVGAPDPDRGMVVTAFVVLAPDVPSTPETARRLQDFVKASIAPYKYPRVIRFVAALPKSPVGKLQRFPLRELASQPPSRQD